MKFHLMTAAVLALALSGCSTTGLSTNAVDARWNGQPAGAFFAKYGPPSSDVDTGGTTVYSWKGGYKTRRIPAEYAKLANGKRGKKISNARSVSLSCAVQITVSSDYIIRDVRVVGDRKADKGASYCNEVLGGA